MYNYLASIIFICLYIMSQTSTVRAKFPVTVQYYYDIYVLDVCMHDIVHLYCIEVCMNLYVWTI